MSLLVALAMAAPPIRHAPHDSGAGFGAALSVGDVDGDGVQEVAIGIDRASQPHDQGGHVQLAHIDADRLVPGLTLIAPDVGGRAGSALDLDGDVNGDGFDDLVVGAFGAGRIHLYLGSASGLPTTPSWSSPPGRGGGFALAVAHVGDLDGDGFGEVAVGAPRGGLGYGEVVVYRGTRAGLVPGWTLDGDELGSHFGAAVSGGPRGWLYVGAPQHGRRGRVHGYRVRGRKLKERAQADGATDGAQFGSTLVANDTLLAVGSTHFLHEHPGRVDVFEDLAQSPRWTVHGRANRGSFGDAIRLVGENHLVVGAFFRAGGATTAYRLDRAGPTLLREDVRTDSPSGGFGHAVTSVDDPTGPVVVVSSCYHPSLRLRDQIEVWPLDSEP